MKRSRFMITLLVVSIVFLLCACGKITEKVSEKAIEKIAEDAIGGDVNITENGGKIEVNGETLEAGESLAWPDDAMGELPKPNANITFVMRDEASKACTVAFAEFSVDDAKKYVDMLKELGFKDGMSMADSDGIFFSGTNSEGFLVSFTYNISANEGTISYSLNATE